jgi:hypothetical protein
MIFSNKILNSVYLSDSSDSDNEIESVKPVVNVKKTKK